MLRKNDDTKTTKNNIRYFFITIQAIIFLVTVPIYFKNSVIFIFKL